MPKKTWNFTKINKLYDLPFAELMYQAQTTHRKHFANDTIQLCALLSIKTGACPEDCAYCPQSGHYNTQLKREKLLPLDKVIAQAKAAKKNGATRFCMGAAWRNPPAKEFPQILKMIKAVQAMGLETCVTLGTLSENQAQQLSEIGLDYYNHNLDTSPDYYRKIITTRNYQERLDTLKHVRKSGIKVCCGGIMGMGESRDDRIEFLLQLLALPQPPESVPINRLIPVPGTPLQNTPTIDNFEFIRTIAITRIVLPESMIRLSAGRVSMSAEMQSLCFMAGANSIWRGDKLLTATNPTTDQDLNLLNTLGIRPQTTTSETLDEPC